MTEKGQTLAVPDKSWWYYKAIGEEVGANILEYTMVEKDDVFDYDDDQIMDILLNKKPRAIIICTPNNPTGNILSEERLEKYFRIFANFDTRIVTVWMNELNYIGFL